MLIFMYTFKYMFLCILNIMYRTYFKDKTKETIIQVAT